MSSRGKTLKDLEDCLSPTDIVLRELQRMARFRSTNEYLESLKPPDPPLNRLSEQARRAAEKSMQGLPREAIDIQADEAEREVLFLWRMYLKLKELIWQELQMAERNINLLYSEFRRLCIHDELSSVTNWFAYPLDSHTAAAVEAALMNQIQSWVSLDDPSTFREWDCSALRHSGDEDLRERRTRISSTIKREFRRLVRSKEVPAGKLVSLPAVPIPFLRNAPLLDGRWVDRTVLELAEFGVILNDRGWTPQATDDSHPLAFQHFVQADPEGRPSPVDDASWHDARQAATDRVRSYRGRCRRFGRRPYVNLSLYQRWRARTLGVRLDALTEHGFRVSSWNDWLKSQGRDVALAGCWAEPIEPLQDPEVWSVHDNRTARRLQTYRTMLLQDLRFSALGGSESDAGEQARIRWRRLAEDAVTAAEGVAAAAESISTAHFRGHEMVPIECPGYLDFCRTKLRNLVRSFDTLSEKREPLQAYFDDRICPQNRESACSLDERDAIERIEKNILHLAERMVRQIVLEARCEAVESMGEAFAAKQLYDQILDEILSR